MVDRFSPGKRSEIMSRVRAKDTKAELCVRSFLHRLGYRFQLHRRDLPGQPDIVLPRYHAVILVHGCFWHQHPGCLKATVPATNREQWLSKLARNVERDKENLNALREAGWRVVTLWECNLKGPQELASSLSAVLSDIEARARKRNTRLTYSP